MTGGRSVAVQVFLGRAADVADPRDLEVLDDGERARAARFVTDELTGHYVGAHAGVRRILAAHLGVPPADIRFGRRPCPRCASPEHGAPRVEWPPGAPHVSLSHTGGRWMFAYSDGHVVGADIEGRREMEVDAIARRVLSAAELEVLAGAADQLSLLLRCWTRKEAVLKAVGVGIAVSMSDVDVSPASVGPVRVDVDVAFGRSSWWVYDVAAGDDAFAAVAVARAEQGPPPVSVTELV